MPDAEPWDSGLLLLELAVVALGVVVGPVTAAVAAVPAAYLSWRWWTHRAKNGIKF